MSVGAAAYKAVPLFPASVSYLYRAPGRWRATGDTTACNKTGGGTKRNLMRTTRPFAHALLSTPDSTLKERWRGLQPNVKRLLTTLDPLRSRSLTSVASWYQSPLSTVARDVVRPATLVRLMELGPESRSMILDRITGLTILLLSRSVLAGTRSDSCVPG